ncbi:hypothetical protein MGYG_05854 [Nannizzia gypsea CBS 118893]|uniref:Uncharacterized protein n=1 Tax=Arthroderma gypseum (strain ATCC MYA-4604 / CBS 118893) TaxID=535722 RepID=E4UZR6_ARTGP|nr:hypothetical protein MGYG_05854 [Nannizzia gypsea CBS 118893]EFR02853.1 hypothetical protein MGYG_05854 [Nannizzia gypsea CBS 118893]
MSPLSTSTFEPSSLSSSAFTFAPRATSDSEDDVASLPSSSGSDSFLDHELSIDSDDESDAEAEWRESLQQLEMLLTMVLIPFVGKFLGRKCAYWGWGKVMEWKYPVNVSISTTEALRSDKTHRVLPPL